MIALIGELRIGINHERKDRLASALAIGGSYALPGLRQPTEVRQEFSQRQAANPPKILGESNDVRLVSAAQR
jgi:hypothetical protein